MVTADAQSDRHWQPRRQVFVHVFSWQPFTDGSAAIGGRASAVELSVSKTLPSARQHPSDGDCLEVNREYYQNCSMLGCVTQCSQSAAHSHEQFLQVQQIGFVTLGPLCHA